MSSGQPLSDVSNVDDLFVLPLERFTAARNQLAARLQQEGKTDEAEAVKKLTKPSVSAWALNLVARRAPENVEPLLQSHRQLRKAKTMEQLRAATEARGTAVSSLIRAAVAQLSAEGRTVSGGTRDQIAQTVMAVANDPQAEADLQAGRLVHALEPGGSGWGDIGLPVPPSPSPEQQATAAAAEARERAARLEQEALEAERSLEQAQQTLTEAKQRAKKARAAADRAAEEERQLTEGRRPEKRK